MAPIERDYMLRVRMTQAEKKMLDGMAERAGLTVSDFVRQLLRREHEATQEKPKRPKR